MSDRPDRTDAAAVDTGAPEPVTAEPVTAEPVTAEPDTAEPDTTGPDTTGPDTTGPDTTGPDTTEPGTTEPDTTRPGTTGPVTTGSGGAAPSGAAAGTSGAETAGRVAEDRSDVRSSDDDGDDGDDDEGSLLDQEGDAAADYLEELLDIADLDGDIDIFEENGRASVAVVAEGTDATALKQLIGRDGAVLDALQELTRLAAQARTGERSRLLLDIGGWREARRAEAARIAKDAIERAKASGEPVDLEPMPAYQRKAVHDAVAAAGMHSESAGVEPSRYVVVHPA